jgi:hypothetical protein
MTQLENSTRVQSLCCGISCWSHALFESDYLFGKTQQCNCRRATKDELGARLYKCRTGWDRGLGGIYNADLAL